MFLQILQSYKSIQFFFTQGDQESPFPVTVEVDENQDKNICFDKEKNGVGAPSKIIVPSFKLNLVVFLAVPYT